MQPFFSVIISLYNKEKHIAATLQSVLDQNFSNFEIIIVNDGSTDSSLSIISGFKDQRISIYSQENSGASNTRNNGISKANGQFIALLDGDDLWESSYLDEMYNTIAMFQDQAVFASAIAHKIENKIVPSQYASLPSKTVNVLNFFQYSLKQSLLSGSSTVFKKEILEVTGQFDPSIKSGQDTDLWIRIGLHYPIVFINKVLVYYVYSSSSLSNTSFNMSDKPKYLNYTEAEKKNNDLKKFLDINRYAMALKSKIYNDCDSFSFYKKHIDESNLSLTKQLLLQSPRWLLLLLLSFKSLKRQKLYYKPL